MATEVPGEFRVRFVERPRPGPTAASSASAPGCAGDRRPGAWWNPARITIVEDRGEQVVREAVFPADGPQGFLVISYPAMAE